MSGRPFDVSDRTVGRLYDTYGAALFRYAAVLLADAVAAEDVLQQVFTTLLRRVPRMDDEAAYLRRAIRNECYSHLRKRREAPADDVALLETLAEPVSHDERIGLERALRCLSVDQREVIHLHVFEGLTFREVAESLAIPANTAAARYRYAIGHLREHLAGSSGRSSGRSREEP